MKKITILTCVFVASIALSSLHAENIEKIFSDIAKEKKAENVKVGGLLMSFAKLFISEKEGKEGEMLKCINSVQVVDLESCDSDKKTLYISRINKIKDENGFETLIRVKDAGDNVRIMLKRNKDKITGFYIVSIDDSSISAVKIIGNFNKEDIEKLINDYNKDDKKG